METAYRGYNLLVPSSEVYASGGSKQWALDMLGNWRTYATDTDGDGDFDGSDTTEERDYNEANELINLDPDGAGGTSDMDLVYDKAGNIVHTEVKGIVCTHDAWNRLVAVETDDVETPIELGEYEYYGLNWRSVKRSDTDAVPNGLDEERVYIYNAGWQIIEERIDSDYVSDPSEDLIAQLHWGTRYIDDLVMRGHFITDSESEEFAHFYALTDVQSSVRAILENDSDVFERVNYTPYGVAEHHQGSDVNNDQASNISDVFYIGNVASSSPTPNIGASTYEVECDLNRDGTIDYNDYAKVISKAKIPDGWISAGGLNDIGYAGYVFNPEITAYLSRFRWYDPDLGRWLQRDPIGYVEGMNTYGYAMGDPLYFIDPLGTTSYSTADMPPGGPDDDRQYEREKKYDVGNPENFEQLMKELEAANYSPLLHQGGTGLIDMQDRLQDLADYIPCLADCILDDPDKLAEVLRDVGIDILQDRLAAADFIGQLGQAIIGSISIDGNGNLSVDRYGLGEAVASGKIALDKQTVERYMKTQAHLVGALQYALINSGGKTNHKDVIAIKEAMTDARALSRAQAASSRVTYGKALKTGLSAAGKLNLIKGSLEAVGYAIAAVREACEDECPCP